MAVLPQRLHVSRWKCKILRKQKWTKESWCKSSSSSPKTNDQCNDAANLPLKMRKSTKIKTINGMRQIFRKKRESQQKQKWSIEPKNNLQGTHQNPEPNELHNASKSCSRQNTSTKIALSRFDHKTMRKKTLPNELDGWKHDGWAFLLLAKYLSFLKTSMVPKTDTFLDLKTCLGKSYRHSAVGHHLSAALIKKKKAVARLHRKTADEACNLDWGPPPMCGKLRCSFRRTLILSCAEHFYSRNPSSKTSWAR